MQNRFLPPPAAVGALVNGFVHFIQPFFMIGRRQHTKAYRHKAESIRPSQRQQIEALYCLSPNMIVYMGQQFGLLAPFTGYDRIVQYQHLYPFPPGQSSTSIFIRSRRVNLEK